jgi:hypothetical protein
MVAARKGWRSARCRHTLRDASAWQRQCRLRLLQPETHAHLAVHRGGGGRQVLLGLRAVPGAPVQFAKAEVGVGDEGAHAEVGGKRQRVAIVLDGPGHLRVDRGGR